MTKLIMPINFLLDYPLIKFLLTTLLLVLKT